MMTGQERCRSIASVAGLIVVWLWWARWGWVPVLWWQKAIEFSVLPFCAVSVAWWVAWPSAILACILALLQAAWVVFYIVMLVLLLPRLINNISAENVRWCHWEPLDFDGDEG